MINDDKRADGFERGPNKVSKLKSMVTEIRHSVEELSSWLDTLKKIVNWEKNKPKESGRKVRITMRSETSKLEKKNKENEKSRY